MSRQVSQVLNEYGLVVIGYSGSDKSILNILSHISEKNDFYWCMVRGSELNNDVKELLEAKRGYVIEIDGFDEMMNEIRHIVGFDVGKMFGSIQERQDQMIEKLRDFAPRYSIDILSEVVEALQKQAKQADEVQKRIIDIQCLDLFTKAAKAKEESDFAKAENFHRKVIDLNPEYKGIYQSLAVLLRDIGRAQEAEEVLRNALQFEGHRYDAYGELCLLLRLQGREYDALQVAESALQLKRKNPIIYLELAAIHKKLGNADKADEYAVQARKLLTDKYNMACLESIYGNKEAAFENLKMAAKNATFDRDWARRDPDFELLREDERFKEIVG